MSAVVTQMIGASASGVSLTDVCFTVFLCLQKSPSQNLLLNPCLDESIDVVNVVI